MPALSKAVRAEKAIAPGTILRIGDQKGVSQVRMEAACIPGGLPIEWNPFQAAFLKDMLTMQVIGFETHSETDELTEFLLCQYLRPEIQVRFKWRKHSIALWGIGAPCITP